MIKYTLCCNKGRMLHSDAHFLCVGEWLPWDDDYVILHHGMLSDLEYLQLSGQQMVNVFQDQKSNTVTIIAPYDKKYLSRHPDMNALQGYIGCLHKAAKNFYIGMVHVK